MATIAAAPIVHGRPIESELKTNTLTLFDTTVIATSSVAPAYSLAATVAFLVVAVGLAAPAAILVSFVFVFFIALAYYYLNRMDPNCGASYSWISRTLSPYAGWLSGWVQLSTNVLFCASAPILAGSYTLQLLNSVFPGQVSADAASNKWTIAGVGVLWLALVTFMVVRGIRVTANFQWVLVAIEYLVVLGFAIFAFLKIISGSSGAANPVHASWFNPLSLNNINGLAAGAALGVFFFWGWDTAANVNEESKDANESPGRAGLYSMFILLFIFLLASSAIQATVSLDDLNNTNNQADILYFFAQKVAGSGAISYLMILAVLSSTVAVLQTTLLPSSRLTFSMARDGVFPKWFGIVHKSWQTPWVGTMLSALLAVLIILLTLLSSNVGSVFGNLILQIGVLVAFYYGLTGIACTWAFRRVLFTSVKLFLFAGLLPFLGGLFLFWVGYQVVNSNVSASIPVLVTMGLGLPLLVVAVVFNRNGFFRERTVSYTQVDGKLTAASTAT